MKYFFDNAEKKMIGMLLIFINTHLIFILLKKRLKWKKLKVRLMKGKYIIF